MINAITENKVNKLPFPLIAKKAPVHLHFAVKEIHLRKKIVRLSINSLSGRYFILSSGTAKRSRLLSREYDSAGFPAVHL